MRNNRVYKHFTEKNILNYNLNEKYYQNSNKYIKPEIDIDKALVNKLDREFKEFCKNLMKKDKKTIIDKAYEITVKEELKEELKNMNLFDAEKEMLLFQDDILTDFYHDWLDCDTPLGESLKECLEESVATLTKYIGRNKNIGKLENHLDNRER